MANEYYLPGGVKIGNTSVPFSQVTMDPGIAELLLGSGANAAPTFGGVSKSEPVARITSPALAVCLGLTGINCATFTGFEVYGIKHGPTGIVAGNVHRKFAMTGGVVRLDSLSWEDGKEASSVIEVMGNFDGTNAPYTITDNVAAPTDVVLAEAFFGGPLYIGTTLYCVTSASFQAGGQRYSPACNGEVTPRLVAVKPPVPKLTVGGYDGPLEALVGALGDNVADVLLFFRKAASGDGGRVADATEEHLSVAIPSAYCKPSAKEGSWGQEMGHSVEFSALRDGTNAPAALALDVAIEAPV